MHVKIFLLCLLLLGNISWAEQPAIPLEELARLPVFSYPIISPDAKNVAAFMPHEGERAVVVQKLLKGDDRDPGKIALIDLPKYHMQNFTWINKDRLLVKARTTAPVQGNLWNITRLMVINREGTEAIPLRMQPDIHGYYRQGPRMISKLEDDPEHILAELDNDERQWGEPHVHKVNIITGKKERVLKSRKGVQRWLADADGVIRIGTRIKADRGRSGVSTFYREAETASWETLQEADYFDHDRLLPLRFDKDDPNILLITTQDLGDGAIPDETVEDTIFRYDLTERRVIGSYVNQHLKDVLNIVEKSIPDLEVEIVSMDKDEQVFFIRVYSDTHSPEYYLLDLNAKTMDYVAAEYPELVNYELAPMNKVSYEAEDGLEIPALLTLPVNRGDEPLPFVIYPHGGPWAHDEWGFDNYVQFFASMGYGVLQPQFRGSTGFGIEHEEAGYGEWGYAIQDDITAGVQWLIDEGIADPEKICIVGSSFGGYAAAVGLAKTPDLYRCGISVNGVLDLKEFIYSGKKLYYEGINRKVWNDPANAKDASPYHLSDQIKAPLLLIGSERDTVVPVKHSKRMHKKLKKNKQSVEYVELPDGEHWRTIESNELIKFRAMRDFLNEHLDAG